MDGDTKTRHTGESPLLPNEIIEEILLRVPVEPLLRFRCVSKPWRSLIGSKHFIETHLRYSSENADFSRHRLLINRHGLMQCNLNTLLKEPIPNLSFFDDSMNSRPDLIGKLSVVGCCNGLVCLLKPPYRFFLWNPSTRVSKELPRAENKFVIPCSTKYGFGWDETSGAYKVFADMHTLEDFSGNVYSSKTDSWKTVELRGSSAGCAVGQCVAGKLHWSSEDVIWYFDLKSEVFGTIEQPFRTVPFYSHGRSTLLGALGGYLCAVCDYWNIEIDVWVMKEYGVKESWSKLVALSVVCEPRQITLFSGRVGPDGEILITYGSTLSIYRSKDHVFRQLRQIAGFDQAYVYVESLVSPLDLMQRAYCVATKRLPTSTTTSTPTRSI